MFIVVSTDPWMINSFIVGLLQKLYSLDRAECELIQTQVQNFPSQPSSPLSLPWPWKSFIDPSQHTPPALFSSSLCRLFWPPPPMVLCFLLFCPPSLCQQVPSINTELSVTGVTIGSCRYSVEGHQSVYRLQLLKCYQLPIHKHTHTDTSTSAHTHTNTSAHIHIHTHTHPHLILFASSSHLIIADAGKFGLVATRSDQMRKQRTTFWLFSLWQHTHTRTCTHTHTHTHTLSYWWRSLTQTGVTDTGLPLLETYKTFGNDIPVPGYTVAH